MNFTSIKKKRTNLQSRQGPTIKTTLRTAGEDGDKDTLPRDGLVRVSERLHVMLQSV